MIVADPREGMARRTDGQTVFINICEHADPVAEMRRVYDAITETLGFREITQTAGNDIFQLKIMLNALGYFRGRVKAARRDSLEAIEFVVSHATTFELQQKCIDALIAKTEILWHLLDTTYAAYVEPGWRVGTAPIQGIAASGAGAAP